ncbi:hypothetical protein HR12_15970 [Microbacterium sp. SUBG005]|nr:hypothetical protein HR12_15970 [Microbacterium sp. SUBG005]
MNAARREQTHNVNGLACGNGFINRSGERWVGKECTFFDFNVQARQVLINDTARTQVNVTHFRVAHLTIRQTHFQARRINQGVGTFLPIAHP